MTPSPTNTSQTGMDDDGGPAFPLPGVTWNWDEGAVTDKGHGGMTLLDWFAGQALIAIIQADGAQFFNITTEHAETAYAKARAMIAERNK